MRTIHLGITAACLISLLITGCASNKAWQYSSNSYPNSNTIIAKKVAVTPFSDSRVNDNSDSLAMYMIPLMPYGWQELNTPEGTNRHLHSGLWQWRPNEDIAKATAEEINRSNIFKETFFTNRASEGDLTLEGAIKSTKYTGKLITYGLSLYGPMFWLFGLPSSSIENQLALEFQLKNNKDGSIVWRKDYTETDDQLSWLYNLKADFNYSELLKSILKKVVNDINSDAAAINKKLQLNN